MPRLIGIVLVEDQAFGFQEADAVFWLFVETDNALQQVALAGFRGSQRHGVYLVRLQRLRQQMLHLTCVLTCPGSRRLRLMQLSA